MITPLTPRPGQVITQIITAEEFWTNHAAEYVKQQAGVRQVAPPEHLTPT